MKRSNNKILFIVLIVLVGGFVLTRVLRSPALEKNLEENLLKIDTAKITEIRISPSAQKGEEIKLIRNSNTWKVQRNDLTAAAENRSLKNAIGVLAAIHPDRVVSRKKEKWSSYKVDTTGTNVKIFTGQKMAADFWVGKSGSGTTCVRLEGEDDVYAVKEMIDTYFNKDFNAWRNKAFLRLEPDKITKITFQYPSDSSYTVVRDSSQWKIDNAKVDSAKVESYLNKFRSRDISEFADSFTPASSPTYQVTMEREGHTPINVRCWKTENDKWILTSSLQDGVYFSAQSAPLINDLFVGRLWFEKQ